MFDNMNHKCMLREYAVEIASPVKRIWELKPIPPPIQWEIQAQMNPGGLWLNGMRMGPGLMILLLTGPAASKIELGSWHWVNVCLTSFIRRPENIRHWYDYLASVAPLTKLILPLVPLPIDNPHSFALLFFHLYCSCSSSDRWEDKKEYMNQTEKTSSLTRRLDWKSTR